MIVIVLSWYQLPFLSDPSPIIGNACHSLTHSLTHSCLVNFIDVTCGFWRCQLKTCWGCYCSWCWWWETFWRQFYADLEAEFWVINLNYVLTLSIRSGEEFEVENWSVFCCLVRLWSECLVRILKSKFGGNADVWLRFWILEFDQDLCKNLWLW